MMKIPQAWAVNASKEEPKAVAASPTAVEARIDMSAEVAGAGLCPDCRQPMERAFMGDEEVLTCIADRITLPIKNAEAPQQ